MSLQGKVAIVTGGVRGIGAAITAALTEAGAQVAVCDRDAPQDGPAAMSVAADVSAEDEVIGFFDRVSAQLGTPDIVVSNAGILHEAPLVDTDIADFDRVIAINLRGTFLVAREAARRMQTGRIITIASDLGYLGRERLSPYCASKGGVISLTRSLARELAPRLLVNAIAPGSTETAMTSPATMSAATIARDLDTPLARFGQPPEIAAMAVFLAGPGGSFITGQVIGVNGGSAMY